MGLYNFLRVKLSINNMTLSCILLSSSTFNKRPKHYSLVLVLFLYKLNNELISDMWIILIYSMCIYISSYCYLSCPMRPYFGKKIFYHTCILFHLVNSFSYLKSYSSLKIREDFILVQILWFPTGVGVDVSVLDTCPGDAAPHWWPRAPVPFTARAASRVMAINCS